MGQMSEFKWLLLLLTVTGSMISALSPWERYTWQTNMFHYGSNTGDEQISVDQLPVMKAILYKPMFGTGIPYNYVKVFADGHLELWYDRDGVQNTIPFIAPYHLPYSKVTSGHVWYRETQDQESLKQVSLEIQKAFPDGGFTVDPDSMVVVTWQWHNVSAQYPECTAQNRAANSAFCDCLDADPKYPQYYRKYYHMVCECLHKLNYSSHCNRLHLPRYYGWPPHPDQYKCACDARGGQYNCARGYAESIGPRTRVLLNAAEVCDYCNCIGGGNFFNNLKSFYCRCKMQNNKNALGMLKCFFRVCPCLDDDAQATEQRLMGCLLSRNFLHCLAFIHFSDYSYMYFCEDPDFDLDYCTCLQDVAPHDPDGDLYCKCDVYSAGRPAGLCQCLVDHGYNGSLPDCNKTRVAPRTNCEADNNIPPKQNMDDYLNNFQAVIVYNEWQTFVYFTYQKLKHSGLNIQTRIGYIDTTSSFTGYNHPYSDDVNLQHFLMFDSNDMVIGKWLYKVGDQIEQQHWTPKPSNVDCSKQCYGWPYYCSYVHKQLTYGRKAQ